MKIEECKHLHAQLYKRKDGAIGIMFCSECGYKDEQYEELVDRTPTENLHQCDCDYCGYNS